MGNYMCVSGIKQQVQDEWEEPPRKVIRPDGTIEVFKRAMTVGVLMNQYPGHLVCHSSAMISALTTKSALPEDKELEGGRLYYVLPSHKFQEKEQSWPAGGRAMTQPRGTLTVEIKSLPGFAQVTVKGRAELMDDDSDGPIISYSTPDLRSMYLSQRPQPSLTRSNSWRPRLETISEVGNASRRHIRNFLRGRGMLKS